MRLPEHVCNALKRERNKYPDTFAGLCDTAGAPNCPLGIILNTVAWEFRHEGWGLSRKDFGYHVNSPAGKIASDILMLPNGDMYDVFINAGLATRVDCKDPIPPNTDPRRHWVAPVDPNGSPVPIPPEPPMDIEQKLDLIILNQDKIMSDLNAIRHESLLAALRAAMILDNQKKERAISLRVPFFGGTAEGTVKGIE